MVNSLTSKLAVDRLRIGCFLMLTWRDDHRIKRTGDHYYCTCPAWRNQNYAVNQRTCKHLREYLGDVCVVFVMCGSDDRNMKTFEWVRLALFPSLLGGTCL